MAVLGVALVVVAVLAATVLPVLHRRGEPPWQVTAEAHAAALARETRDKRGQI